MNGFDIRFENYNKIHSNSKEDWDAFLKAINLKDNEIILDAAGGYGDVSFRTFKIANPLIYVVDSSKE